MITVISFDDNAVVNFERAYDEAKFEEVLSALREQRTELALKCAELALLHAELALLHAELASELNELKNKIER